MRGVIVPPSKLIVTIFVPPKGGVLIKGGRLMPVRREACTGTRGGADTCARRPSPWLWALNIDKQ